MFVDLHGWSTADASDLLKGLVLLSSMTSSAPTLPWSETSSTCAVSLVSSSFVALTHLNVVLSTRQSVLIST